jgi:type III pantothenate kinase
MVNYLVRRMAAELGEPGVHVVATGGLARMIADEAEVIDVVNDHLTLEGLRILYLKNKRLQRSL